ncbi:LysE family translocator [Tenggerimyces flavus]|uniref:LysE family translocator n=1 Tax=Tenggerimyces flavus TaxID=1708749 RepID=A0ABV7YIC2_9ACTN|nr:LysE family translocator [Tenggerimyces flavus]MBM7786846.1 threonine/homoserine/homoserine lactone efflux protein [Tenggerimyces flavus]
MEFAAFVAFLSVSAVVIVTPGPDTAMSIRNTLLGGRRVGIATGLGVSLGQLAWTLAASAGIAALLVASEPAFLAVKLVGAAYLIVLGLHSLYSAWKSRSPAAVVAVSRRRMSSRGGLGQGVVSNLSNPKMAVFFMALLPQFVPSGGATFWWSALLGLVFCVLTFLWLCCYAFVVAKAGSFLRTPRVKRVLDAVTGTVLVGLGVRIAVERA